MLYDIVQTGDPVLRRPARPGTLHVDQWATRSFTTTSNLGRHWKSRPAAEVRAALGTVTGPPRLP